MAQDQFSVTINKETLSKILDNILVNSLPDKDLMVQYLAKLIMKGYAGNDFFMALTNTFPEIKFRPGDKVRIATETLYYNIDVDRSIEEGYIIDHGIYVEVTSIDPVSCNCYKGIVRFIDKSNTFQKREMEFNPDCILMDNTIVPAKPAIVPGDLI
jgi:hypothetical protein